MRKSAWREHLESLIWAAAIALAIRAKVPVLVEDRVFDKSGSARPPRGPSI